MPCQVVVQRGGILVHCGEQAVWRCGPFRYCVEHRKRLGGHGAPPHTFRSIPLRLRIVVRFDEPVPRGEPASQ